MCYMGWLYEFIANAFLVFIPTLHKFGVPNTYMVGNILMFVVIPVVHLMNDEVTKGIILEDNWYQGLRHMMGMYNKTQPISRIQQTNKEKPSKHSSSYHVTSNPDKHNTIRHKKHLTLRGNSYTKLCSSEMSITLKQSKPLQRSNSWSNFILA